MVRTDGAIEDSVWLVCDMCASLCLFFSVGCWWMATSCSIQAGTEENVTRLRCSLLPAAPEGGKQGMMKKSSSLSGCAGSSSSSSTPPLLVPEEDGAKRACTKQKTNASLRQGRAGLGWAGSGWLQVLASARMPLASDSRRTKACCFCFEEYR